MRFFCFHILCLAMGIALTACEEQAEPQAQPEPITQSTSAPDLPPRTEPDGHAGAAREVPPAPPKAPVQAPAPQAAQSAATPGETHKVSCDSIAYKMPSFVPFLQQFKQALTVGDLQFIYDTLADDVKFDFGGGYGKDAFMRHWGLDSETPERSDFWLAARRMLELGGYEQKNAVGTTEAVIFPCTFKPLPDDNWIARRFSEFSAYDYMIVTQNGAPFTDADGNLLRRLEYGETLLMPSGGSYDTIQTHDGLGGFVSQNDIRSPIDYRMFFIPIRGQWKITLFIRGD